MSSNVYLIFGYVQVIISITTGEIIEPAAVNLRSEEIIEPAAVNFCIIFLNKRK